MVLTISPERRIEEIVQTFAEGAQRQASVAFDGPRYFVVWTDHRGDDQDIYGARIDSSGALLDPGGIVISNASGDQNFPVVAFDGNAIRRRLGRRTYRPRPERRRARRTRNCVRGFPGGRGHRANRGVHHLGRPSILAITRQVSADHAVFLE